MSSGEFVPEIALENPDALRNIHKDFQHAGSDVVQSFHLQWSPRKNESYR